ncbi:hypothetical protein PVL29_003710 [Vitis rotundifolia]|uniref:Uncharacterized protein n=1 Tax=Vitis rotundifolia TaxID=103349 RepID=A0AA39E3F9_VITRO|nr:hypothetical protein PVL29_003710 [Vitis rotundifolia]
MEAKRKGGHHDSLRTLIDSLRRHTQPYSTIRGTCRITDSIQDTAVHESFTFSVPGRLHNMRTKTPSLLPYERISWDHARACHCQRKLHFLANSDRNNGATVATGSARSPNASPRG